MVDELLISLNDIKDDSIGLIHQRAALGKRGIVVKKFPKKADSFDNIFDYADAYGKVRFGYFVSDYKVKNNSSLNKRKFNSNIGGIAGIKSVEYKGFGFNIATYISQDLPFLYNTNYRGDISLSKDKKSYAYIAEASLDYSNDKVSINVGRFAKDTPYLNTDDIRMTQDTYEGAFGEFNLNDNLTIDIIYAKRWAGFDSADGSNSQNEFKNLVEGSFGLVGTGLTYSFDDENQASFWGYYVDKYAVLLYGEADGKLKYDYGHIDYGFETAYNKELGSSNVNGIVVGGLGIFHIDEFFISLADDFAFVKVGDVVSDGFGGGPYLTSLNEATIATVSEIKQQRVGETKNNINFFRTGFGYDIPAFDSSLEYTFGYVSMGVDAIKENDIIYTYNKDDKITFEAIAILY